MGDGCGLLGLTLPQRREAPSRECLRMASGGAESILWARRQAMIYANGDGGERIRQHVRGILMQLAGRHRKQASGAGSSASTSADQVLKIEGEENLSAPVSSRKPEP